VRVEEKERSKRNPKRKFELATRNGQVIPADSGSFLIIYYFLILSIKIFDIKMFDIKIFDIKIYDIKIFDIRY